MGAVGQEGNKETGCCNSSGKKGPKRNIWKRKWGGRAKPEAAGAEVRDLGGQPQSW